ncbi:hypothetical protein JI58_01245 [Marinosulfonomonas sp. PRT-SC04]|nr:hypothetical protein JI58_01245 [Marinosulfonomonas sp. PRT-SC04]
MRSPHDNPSANGTVFGTATVTVDLDAGDCVISVAATGYRRHQPRFHSLDEIQGAYQVQIGLAATAPVAGDIARALKFAAQQLKNHQEGKQR